MRSIIVAVVLTVAGGCPAPNLTPCGALLCPAADSCRAGRCVTPAQITACDGLADGAACSAGRAGECMAGACAVPVCGNAVLELGEDCEGSAGATSCSDRGFDAGTLACSAFCQFDTSACTGICGDGTRDADEQCDGSDLGARTCVDVGYYRGQLQCSALCSFDTAQCAGTCGDGIVEAAELCDGAPPPGECVDHGYDYGALGCTSCAASYTACHRIGWQVQDLDGSDNPVGASVTAAGAVYIIGGHGKLFRRGAGSTAWTTIPFTGTDPGVAFVDVLASSDGDVDALAAGASAFVYHYDGSAWTATSLGTYSAQQFVRAGGVRYVIGAHAVWRNTSGSWLREDLAGAAIRAAAPIPNGTIVLVGDGGTILAGSTTLSPMTSGVSVALRAVWARTATDIYAAGDSGTLLHFDGGNWSAVDPGVTADHYTFVSGGPNDVFVGGFATPGSTAPFVVHFDGSRWTDEIYGAGALLRIVSTSAGGDFVGIHAPSSAPLHDVLATDGSGWRRYHASSPSWPRALRQVGNELWVGLSGEVGRLGTTWSLTTIGTRRIDGIYVASPTSAYVIADGPVVKHWDGNSWQDEPVTLPTEYLGGIWGVGEEVFVTTLWAGLWHRATDGTWTHMTSAIADATILYGLWGSSASDVWAGGYPGILHYDGQSWTQVTLPTTVTIKMIRGTSSTDVYASGAAGNILHFDGSNWAVAQTRGGVLRDVDTAIAVGRGGLLEIADGGTWSALRAPDPTIDYGGAVLRLDAKRYAIAMANDSGLQLYELRLP